MLVTGVIGALLGVALGIAAALRKGGRFDHVTAVGALAVTSLPEFVVAIGLVILLVHGAAAPAARGVRAAAGQLRLERGRGCSSCRWPPWSS